LVFHGRVFQYLKVQFFKPSNLFDGITHASTVTGLEKARDQSRTGRRKGVSRTFARENVIKPSNNKIAECEMITPVGLQFASTL